MNDHKWDFAKQIAQSDGRKDDWIYVVDIYKSIGGQQVALLMYGESGFQCEVCGEVSPTQVLISKQGELEVVERNFLKKSRKKFVKRNLEEFVKSDKSLEFEGQLYTTPIYTERKDDNGQAKDRA